MDARAHSLDAASRWRCHSIDTARARDRDGNCGYWRHRPRASCHRLPGAARVPPVIGLLDNAASHPAGGQNLAPRSGLLSRAERLLLVRTPEQEPARGTPCVQWGVLEQTRWCAPDQDEADARVRDGGSRAIEICTSLMAKQAESGLMRCGKFLQRRQRRKQNTRGVAASENTGCGMVEWYFSITSFFVRSVRCGMLLSRYRLPLGDDLPALLAQCRMADPAVGVLFLVFIRQRILKGSPMQIQRHYITGGNRALR